MSSAAEQLLCRLITLALFSQGVRHQPMTTNEEGYVRSTLAMHTAKPSHIVCKAFTNEHCIVEFLLSVAKHNKNRKGHFI